MNGSIDARHGAVAGTLLDVLDWPALEGRQKGTLEMIAPRLRGTRAIDAYDIDPSYAGIEFAEGRYVKQQLRDSRAAFDHLPERRG